MQQIAIDVIDWESAAQLAAKTPAERISMVGELNSIVRAHVATSIRDLHPDWTEKQIRAEVVLRMLEAPLDSPHDLVIAKLICLSPGGSERHFDEIVGILRVHGAKVNRNEVERWAIVGGISEIWCRATALADGQPTT
jgi:hypothetical protein